MPFWQGLTLLLYHALLGVLATTALVQIIYFLIFAYSNDGAYAQENFNRLQAIIRDLSAKHA